MAYLRYVVLASVLGMFLSRPVCLILGLIAGMWISEINPGLAPKITAAVLDYADTAVNTMKDVDFSKMSEAVEEARKNNKGEIQEVAE